MDGALKKSIEKGRSAKYCFVWENIYFKTSHFDEVETALLPELL